MARQHGPLRLTGPIGNLSFYYHKEYGYLVREQGGPRPGNVSPRTKENGDELGAASRTGKLIRQGMRTALHLSGDSTVSQRLTGCLYRILQHDRTSARGERTVANGLTSAEGRQLLKAFAFHKDRSLAQVLHDFPRCSEDGSFLFGSFQPGRDLVWPSGATHVQLQGGLVFVNPAEDSYTAFGTGTVVLPRHAAEGDVTLAAEGELKGGGFRVAVMGIVFLQEVNGEVVGLKEGRIAGVV